MSRGDYILGIWDGHDAGAALVRGEQVVFAVNEERLSRRKLDIGFPARSITACLDFAGLRATDVRLAAASTSDFAKTLTRCFPRLREEYYLIRRRKRAPGAFTRLKKAAKYRLTEWPPSAVTRAISRRVLRVELARAGFDRCDLRLLDHHTAHAAAAAFCSGFDDALVLTLDGIGDALSGTASVLTGGRLTPVMTLSGKTSFGIFFEHVTNLLNMRELEDEGKVMALANYAYPVPDADNPLLDFLTVDGLDVKARYGAGRMYRELARVLWRFPAEQFAYMAQRALEVRVVEWVRGALERTGRRRLAYAGGVASNVKVNMLLRELPGLDGFFVFPHMGDGGLAAGAAMLANHSENGVRRYGMEDIYWGPAASDEEIRRAAAACPGVVLEPCADVVSEAAERLMRREILMWFQGRMEFGPRALGARSILALPDSAQIKDTLNLRLKRRVWYQPFCPTLLHEDALASLEGYRGPPDRFMTCAYRVKPEKREALRAVINVDGSCRPQILPADGSGIYTRLLREVRRRTGMGALLNTSFNLHGEPIVCSAADALRTFGESGMGVMFINGFMATRTPERAGGEGA